MTTPTTDDDFGPEFLTGEEPPADQVTITVDAPYGINPKTGKPFRMSPEQRAAMADRLTQGRQDAAMKRGPGPTRRARTASSARAKAGPPPLLPAGVPRSKAPAGPNYYQTVLGLLQGVAFGLKAAGRFSVAFEADAVTVEHYGPGLATALHELAVDNKKIGAILDRVGAVGPYSALFAAATPLIFQLATNHGVLKPGGFGTTDVVGALTEQRAAERGDQDDETQE